MATQLEEAASGGSVDNVTVRLQMVLGMEGVTYKGNSDVWCWASAGRRQVTAASSLRRTVVFLAPRLPVGPLQLLLPFFGLNEPKASDQGLVALFARLFAR